MERLDKVLAATGRWSRREVKQLVRQGQVRVNGAAAASAEEKVEPETAVITVGGERTVLDLLPPELRKRGLSPVGRLDKDTEGLLLLTDDGELAHRLLSPKYHVDKRYFARVDGPLDQADVDAFAAGMTLGDGLMCLPAGLEPLEAGTCIVTLREGKFHQVKRMLAARGAPVLYLKRLSMGPLTLDAELPIGGWRELTAEETASLRCTAGL